MLEQNVYQADLTAGGILRLLQRPFCFLLPLKLFASNLQIHDRAKYCSFGHSFSNGGLKRALHDSQAFWFVFVTVFFSDFSKNRAKLLERDIF